MNMVLALDLMEERESVVKIVISNLSTVFKIVIPMCLNSICFRQIQKSTELDSSLIRKY